MKPTIEELRTQDIAGFPVDWAVYQARINPAEPLTKKQMLEIIADKTAAQVAAQIQLSELYHGKSYPAEPKLYPLANLELQNDMTPASAMPEKPSNTNNLTPHNSINIDNLIDRILDWSVAISKVPVFQGMFIGLLIESVVFSAAWLVAKFVFGQSF